MVLYPNEAGKTFDHNYYAEHHMPVVAQLFGDSMRRYEIDKGLVGRTPAEAVPYVATGYFYFDRLSTYRTVFAEHAKQILADIPNHTDIRPVVQVSEVV